MGEGKGGEGSLMCPNRERAAKCLIYDIQFTIKCPKQKDKPVWRVFAGDVSESMCAAIVRRKITFVVQVTSARRRWIRHNRNEHYVVLFSPQNSQ